MIGGLVVAWRRAAVRGLATGAKGVGTSKRKRKNEYKPSGPIDAFCHNWLGMPVAQTSRIVALCLAAGFVMETFMVKVWIGQTNCALGWDHNARPNSSLTPDAHAHNPPTATHRSRPHTGTLPAVYETVKKKEAEKRRDAAGATQEERFVDVLKQQWEERKREMDAATSAKPPA